MSDTELPVEDGEWLAPSIKPALKWSAKAISWKRLAFAAGIVVIVGTSFYGICFAKPSVVAKATDLPADTRANVTTIVVDVHGDVRRPGLYTLPANARVFDAIRAAGGYLHQADADAVNGAAPVDDGAEVVVPASSERGSSATVTPSPGGSNASAVSHTDSSGGDGAGSSRVDVNTADETTLETLPGIGPKRAHDIIDYRQQHGLYRSVADLRQVRGIGAATLNRLQPYLFVSSTH